MGSVGGQRRGGHGESDRFGAPAECATAHSSDPWFFPANDAQECEIHNTELLSLYLAVIGWIFQAGGGVTCNRLYLPVTICNWLYAARKFQVITGTEIEPQRHRATEGTGAGFRPAQWKLFMGVPVLDSFYFRDGPLVVEDAFHN